MPTGFRALVYVVLVSASILRGASDIEFVHITDTHVADFSGVRSDLAAARRRNQKSADALRRFFDRIGSDAPPAFLVHTGDAIEAYCFDGAAGRPVYGQIALFQRIYSRSRIPLYLALGNHDIECYRQSDGANAPTGDQTVSREARREWTHSFRCLRKGTYYILRQRVGRTTYRFLFLDNGEGLQTIDPRLRANQFRWLADQVAGHPREAIILVMHIPFRNDWFFKGVASAIGGFGSVRLAIAGHRHSNGIEEIPLGKHPVTQIRTASLASGELNWRRFRLAEDHIEIDDPGNTGRILKTIPVR